MPPSQSEMNTIRTVRLRLTQERAKDCISGHLVAEHIGVNAWESANTAGSQIFQSSPDAGVNFAAVVWCAGGAGTSLSADHFDNRRRAGILVALNRFGATTEVLLQKRFSAGVEVNPV